jgi:hypothetical protein
MGKYRKKPVVIEAMQWDGGEETGMAILEWSGGLAQYATDRVAPLGAPSLTIETLEGILYASPGDWIIRGIKGEFYPCKPDIFDATYEPAKDTEPHG